MYELPKVVNIFPKSDAATGLSCFGLIRSINMSIGVGGFFFFITGGFRILGLSFGNVFGIDIFGGNLIWGGNVGCLTTVLTGATFSGLGGSVTGLKMPALGLKPAVRKMGGCPMGIGELLFEMSRLSTLTMVLFNGKLKLGASGTVRTLKSCLRSPIGCLCRRVAGWWHVSCNNASSVPVH